MSPFRDTIGLADNPDMACIIHPTAIVSANAKLGDDCYVGPYCIIGPNVTLGRSNRLEAHVSIGTNAEHREYFRSEPGEVVIGDGNVIREFVTINAGTTNPTVVESRCVFLRGSHVGHDAVIRNSAHLSCNVLVGGHSIIGQGANLGLGASVHQHRAVGAYAMVGMNSAVTRHLPPFLVCFGVPARTQRVNRIGLLRAGVIESDLKEFENWFQMFEHNNAMNPISHEFNGFLAQYLRDCQSFQKPHIAAAA